MQFSSCWIQAQMITWFDSSRIRMASNMSVCHVVFMETKRRTNLGLLRIKPEAETNKQQWFSGYYSLTLPNKDTSKRMTIGL
jgi:hypothetical protein